MTADPPRRRVSPAPAAGGSDGARPQRSAGRNLPAAIASGLALAVVFVAVVLIEALVAVVLVALVAGVALHELHTALRDRGLRPATPVIAGAAVVMVLGTHLHGPAALAVGLVLATAGTAVWGVLIARVDDGSGEDPPRPGDDGDRDGEGPATPLTRAARATAASALMVCWVPLMAGFVGLLLDRPGGEWYLLAAIALSVSNDIGAYAFGNRFGRRKLAPHVSPAKTWEGFAGGLLTVVVLAGVVTARGADFTVATAVGFGVAVVVAATVGDLIESLVKRDLGVKDLGSVLPGHGGVMDRVDGILLALPTAHITLMLVGL